MRIPATRRYLEDKRAIAVALQEAVAERDLLAAELASVRAAADARAAEIADLRGKLQAAAAGCDSLLEQVQELQTNRRKNLLQIEEDEFMINAVSIERDAVLNQLRELQRMESKHKSEMQIAQPSLTRAVCKND